MSTLRSQLAEFGTIAHFEAETAVLDAGIRKANKVNARSRQLKSTPDVGPITAHAAFVTAGDATAFRPTRAFSASLSPTQRPTGQSGMRR